MGNERRVRLFNATRSARISGRLLIAHAGHGRLQVSGRAGHLPDGGVHPLDAQRHIVSLLALALHALMSAQLKTITVHTVHTLLQ